MPPRCLHQRCGTGVATTIAATIGFDGGTLTLDGATVTFPPGALGSDTAIALTHEASGPATGYADTGREWSLAPASLVLAPVR